MITVFSNVVQQDTLKGLWKGLVPVSISTLIFNDKIIAYILDWTLIPSQLEYNHDDAKMHLLNTPKTTKVKTNASVILDGKDQYIRFNGQVTILV